MKDTTRPVPDHVPDEWTAQYAGPDPEDVWARRLTEIERSARNDMRWLTSAGVMCMLVLLMTLGWARLVLRAALAQRTVTIVVIAAAFAVCLWLIHRTHRMRRPSPGKPRNQNGAGRSP